MHGRWTYTSREVCGRRWMLKAAVCMCVLLCGQLLVTSCGVVIDAWYILVGTEYHRVYLLPLCISFVSIFSQWLGVRLQLVQNIPCIHSLHVHNSQNPSVLYACTFCDLGFATSSKKMGEKIIPMRSWVVAETRGIKWRTDQEVYKKNQQAVVVHTQTVSL